MHKNQACPTMMHRNNKQLSSSNINAQTIKLKLSQVAKFSQLKSNQATTNFSHSKLSQQAFLTFLTSYNQYYKKTFEQKIYKKTRSTNFQNAQKISMKLVSLKSRFTSSFEHHHQVQRQRTKAKHGRKENAMRSWL
jgi:hypothetical protein